MAPKFLAFQGLHIKTLLHHFLSSGTLTQAIRNFAKGLEGWLTSAMENAPPDVVHVKVEFVIQ